MKVKELLFVVLVLFGSMLFSQRGIAQTVELATGDWAPYTSKSMDGLGAFTEIISAAFERMGDKPNYSFLPWKRAEDNLEKGEVFAIFPYFITDERKPKYNFSDRVMYSTGRFFYLNKKITQKIEFENFSDLAKYKIGGTRGYWYESNFKEAGLSVDYATTDEQSIQKLQAGRVDLVPSGELVGWEIIKRLFPNDAGSFSTVEKPTNQGDLHLMVSKSYPNSDAILSKFNAALNEIREQGVIKSILEKHGVKE
jgi:polar amino acid transport system substrate-binding protein